MSHWSTVETEFTNEQGLIDALKEMHPEHEVVKGGNVRGYQGTQKADIVLKGKNMTRSSGFDIGFKKNANGMYSEISDWYGLDWLGDKSTFQDRLKQSYAKAVVKRRAKKFGWTIKEKQQEDGTVKLSLTKF